jgi:microsomal dipeptidase-like Zn-dependent dipeptidase
MNGNAKLKDSTSPQMIIEKLARKRISEEEAEKALQQQWVRVYDTPTVVRFLQEIFQNGGANRRISK